MRKSREKAFTLVELLICLALSVLVGGILYLLQSTGSKQLSKGITRLILQSGARLKLERMISDLRCAKEVLEITPSSIKIGMDRAVGGESTGNIEYITVTYAVEKDKGKSKLIRTENQEAPVEIFSTEKIDEEIFFPFFETPPEEDQEDPIFTRFDMRVNDSAQRKRITFIRIRLKMVQNKESVTLATAVSLRQASQLLKQPHWKYR